MVENEVREYILTKLDFSGSRDELTGDTDLIESEVIDSLAIFELVGMIEDRYEVEVDDTDLVLENFVSIDAIASMVRSKLALSA